MARGDLLKKLLLAYQRGEDRKFKEISLEIIRDERRKNHNVLADQLQKIIETDMNVTRTFRNFSDIVSLPRDDNETPLIEIRKPHKYLDDVILSEQNKEMIGLPDGYEDYITNPKRLFDEFHGIMMSCLRT